MAAGGTAAGALADAVLGVLREHWRAGILEPGRFHALDAAPARPVTPSPAREALDRAAATYSRAILGRLR